MYYWRHLSETARKTILDHRQNQHLPWHSPPHYSNNRTRYMITAACYDHAHIIGYSLSRMKNFEMKLLKTIHANSNNIYAWILLPNHYHVLIDTTAILSVLSNLGQLHGSTAYQWNGQETKRGRQVWHNSAEKVMKSDRHFFATMNYIHNNPVVKQWQDWPFSSVHKYLKSVGHEKAQEIWENYPVLQYGDDWDPADL